MNVAALGNMVPQLHFHHVVRYQNDVAYRNLYGVHQPCHIQVMF